MNPAKQKLLASFALCAAAAGLFFGLRPKPVPVETTTARYASMRTTVLEEGKTRIRNRYVVSSAVGGLLRRTTLRPGDKVQVGVTKVAIIDPEPSTLLTPRDVGQSEARIKAAEAALQQREAEQQRAAQAPAAAQPTAIRQQFEGVPRLQAQTAYVCACLEATKVGTRSSDGLLDPEEVKKSPLPGSSARPPGKDFLRRFP
jgi:HlyD family secretion protein